MTIGLRVLLILGSALYFVFVIGKIRASSIELGDTFFWTLFSLFLLVISLFPGIMGWLCRIIGIQSPANMVYLSIIALLAYKCFSMAVKLSELNMKVKTLVSAQSAQAAAEKEEQGDGVTGREEHPA